MTQVLRSNFYRHLQSSVTIIIFLKYRPLVFEETLILSLLTEHEKDIQKLFFSKEGERVGRYQRVVCLCQFHKVF